MSASFRWRATSRTRLAYKSSTGARIIRGSWLCICIPGCTRVPDKVSRFLVGLPVGYVAVNADETFADLQRDCTPREKRVVVRSRAVLSFTALTRSFEHRTSRESNWSRVFSQSSPGTNSHLPSLRVGWIFFGGRGRTRDVAERSTFGNSQER